MFALQNPQQRGSLVKWTFNEIGKIKSVFESFKVSSQLIKCEELSMVWLVNLKNLNPNLVKLQTKWHMSLKEYIQVRIELIDSDNIFNYNDFNIKVSSLIKEINSRSKGVYYAQTDSNKLIASRFKIYHAFNHYKTYLEANFKEIFNEVSFQVHSYVINANLIKGERPINLGIHDCTSKLAHLRECFESERQKRQKATYVNLSNFQIKNISEYSQIIEMSQKKLIKSTKMYDREIKFSKDKCLAQKNKIWNKIYGLLKNEIEKLKEGIANNICIKNIIAQRDIDSGGFGNVFLGIYELAYMLTCNMNSINQLIMVEEDQEKPTDEKNVNQTRMDFHKELIRKLPKAIVDEMKLTSKSAEKPMKSEKMISQMKKREEIQKKSFENERLVIKFLRNAKIPFIAKYYIPTECFKPAFNDGIYLDFYPQNLAKAKEVFKHHQLFKVMKQVLMGIFVLWQNKILHRDLKEYNIMVNNQGNARIIDLGSCCPMISDNKKPKENIFMVNSYNQSHFQQKEMNMKSIQDEKRQIFRFHDNSAKHERQQIYNVHKELISTKGYYFSYNELQIQSIKQNYTKNQFYEADNFDMFAIGRMIINLFDLDIVQDALYHRELVFMASKCMEINPQDRYNPIEALCYLFQIHSLFINEMKIHNSSNIQNIPGSHDK